MERTPGLSIADELVELFPGQPNRDLCVRWGPVDSPLTDSQLAELFVVAPNLEYHVGTQNHFGCRDSHLHVMLRQLPLLTRRCDYELSHASRGLLKEWAKGSA